MSAWRWYLALLGLVFFSAAVAAPRTLTIGYDDYCPYTCVDFPRRGFVIDLVERILEPHGYAIKGVEASWPRIKSMAASKSLDLFAPVNAVEAREIGILRTTHSVGESKADYFVDKNSNWTYNGVDSLITETLAIVSGYAYPPPLDAYLNDPANKHRILELASHEGTPRQIDLLRAKRATVVPAESAVFWFIAGQKGVADQFKAAGTLEMPEEIAVFYVGVATKDPVLAHNLVSWLNEGLVRLKENGEYAEILAEYEMLRVNRNRPDGAQGATGPYLLNSRASRHKTTDIPARGVAKHSGVFPAEL